MICEYISLHYALLQTDFERATTKIVKIYFTSYKNWKLAKWLQ